MGLPTEKEPDLPNLWLLWLWLALSCFWFYLCQDFTPRGHKAYWHEATATAAWLGLGFTMLLGFFRPANWLAALSIVPLAFLLPAVDSHSLCAFFYVSYYFTVVFSFGNTLTLRKMAKISGISAILIGFGCTDRGENLGLGMLAWLSLVLVMLLVNGCYRLVRAPLGKPARAKLPELE